MAPLTDIFTSFFTVGLSFLKLAITSIVTRVLAALGLTMVSVASILPDLKAYIMQFIGVLPPQVIQLLGALHVDVVISLIFSALTVRFAFTTFILPTSVAQSLRSGVGQ